jgi:hypothetical protein
MILRTPHYANDPGTDESLMGALDSEDNATGSMTVFPNPSSDVVHFSLLPVPTETLFWEIVGIDGRTMLSGDTDPSADASQAINVSSLPAGTYVLRVQTGDQFFTEKVLVSK